MLGVLITLAFSLGMSGLGLWGVRKIPAVVDPTAKAALAGLFGLGFAGLVTFFLGLIPGGLRLGPWLMLILAVIGAAHLIKKIPTLHPRITMPNGLHWLFPAGIAVAALWSLVGVLAPSDMLDWDSLAYHLAVPKLWLEAGQMVEIPFIHHSYFPFVVDNLYIWGLSWGGQHGAKAFSLVHLLLGACSMFGLARQRFSAKAGWWAALAFTGTPVVLWLSGTAYIDVAHGLYAGLGVIFAAFFVEKPEAKGYLWISALCLGFAAASKHTGLQTIFAVGLVVFVLISRKSSLRVGLSYAATLGVLAVVIASPWYIRNTILTGNPVYPFFYERLGGRHWDERRAEIYRNEQQTFGVGRAEAGRDPLAIGHAILGLAYQPGRFVNPGQEAGLGTPLGAVGVPVIASLLLGLVWRRRGAFEAAILGAAGISLLMWFFLSQQSRYITSLAPPLLLLGAGIAVRKRPLAGKEGTAIAWMMGIVLACQFLYTLWMVRALRANDQLQAVLGRVSVQEYQRATIPFYEPSFTINEAVADGKVALYDEVFGYLLDVPYFWANPGHSTLIPYYEMTSAEDYAVGMRELGFTHVYVSFFGQPRDFLGRWLGSMGLLVEPGIPPEEREALLADWQSKWRVLLADAVAEGHLVPVEQFRSGLLFRLR
jgi:4-amino-4-deoxy-L-arabinose transferase-like glycosyltransferase